MTHDVTLSLPQVDVGRSDVEFKVKQNGSVLGTLKLSKGALVWVRRDAQYGHKLAWRAFDSLMREHAKHEKDA